MIPTRPLSRTVLSVSRAGIPPSSVVEPVDVLPGDAALQSGRLPRGAREYRLVVRRHDGERPDGHVQHQVSATRFGGVRGLLVVQSVRRWKERSLTMTFLERDTLRPLWSRQHGPAATFSAEFDWDLVDLSWMPNRGRGWSRLYDLEAPAFDAFSLPWVLAALPLRPGYTARLPCFSLPRHRFEWVVATVVGPVLHPRSARPTGSLLVEATGEQSHHRYVISTRQRTLSRAEAIVRGDRPWRLDQPRHLVDPAPALDVPA